MSSELNNTLWYSNDNIIIAKYTNQNTYILSSYIQSNQPIETSDEEYIKNNYHCLEINKDINSKLTKSNWELLKNVIWISEYENSYVLWRIIKNENGTVLIKKLSDNRVAYESEDNILTNYTPTNIIVITCNNISEIEVVDINDILGIKNVDSVENTVDKIEDSNVENVENTVETSSNIDGEQASIIPQQTTSVEILSNIISETKPPMNKTATRVKILFDTSKFIIGQAYKLIKENQKLDAILISITEAEMIFTTYDINTKSLIPIAVNIEDVDDVLIYELVI